jgi:stage III sporulation protein AH
MRNEERAAMRASNAEETNILELPENEEKNFTFKSFFAGGAKVWEKFGVRNFVIVFSVLLIGVAVYVNWTLFGNANDIADPNDDPKGAQTSVNGENGDSSSADGDKNGSANFFAASQIERQRARDEAIEVLQSVVDDATALDVAKEQALADIAAIAATIETEANIESLVKAKGFEECVAVINGDKANIIVKSEGLKPNELSQILEIVYLQADILPANVTISEK